MQRRWEEDKGGRQGGREELVIWLLWQITGQKQLKGKKVSVGSQFWKYFSLPWQEAIGPGVAEAVLVRAGRCYPLYFCWSGRRDWRQDLEVGITSNPFIQYLSPGLWPATSSRTHVSVFPVSINWLIQVVKYMSLAFKPQQEVLLTYITFKYETSIMKPIVLYN